VWLSTTFDRPPKYNAVFIFFAFAISIVWIYLIANEIVALLQTLGSIFGISYTILALTVLAWGNSISDLVADVIVARKGIPAMAIAACFAGPLFNTLIGLGIGLMVQCVKQFPANLEVHLSLKLYAGFLFLVISLLSSLIVIPICGYHVKKGYGIYLIFLTLAFSGVCITLEVLNPTFKIPRIF